MTAVLPNVVRMFERDFRRVCCRTPDTAAIDAAKRTRSESHQEYRKLLQEKREAFWKNKVSSESSSPRQLWNSIDTLMGREQIPLTTAINAETAHKFFYAKVAGVRRSTENASLPVFSAVIASCSLCDFRQLTADDVIAAIRQMPD